MPQRRHERRVRLCGDEAVSVEEMAEGADASCRPRDVAFLFGAMVAVSVVLMGTSALLAQMRYRREHPRGR